MQSSTICSRITLKEQTMWFLTVGQFWLRFDDRGKQQRKLDWKKSTYQKATFELNSSEGLKAKWKAQLHKNGRQQISRGTKPGLSKYILNVVCGSKSKLEHSYAGCHTHQALEPHAVTSTGIKYVVKVWSKYTGWNQHK